MADYFVSLKRIFPQGDPIFIGPFDKKNEALLEIKDASKKAEFEIVIGENNTPNDVSKAILVEILTKTNARRTGMKSIELFGDKKDTLIGERIPLSLEEVGIQRSENDNGKKEKANKIIEEIVDEDMDREYNGISEIPKLESDVILSDYEKSEAIIVTKFPANIEWLRQHGVQGEVTVRAMPDKIKGKSVVGTLPYRLGTLAKRVGVIDIPGIRADQIGTSLSTDDLYDAEAKLRWFRVIEEKNEWIQLFNYLDKPGGWRNVLQLIKNQ